MLFIFRYAVPTKKNLDGSPPQKKRRRLYFPSFTLRAHHTRHTHTAPCRPPRLDTVNTHTS